MKTEEKVAGRVRDMTSDLAGPGGSQSPTADMPVAPSSNSVTPEVPKD